MHLLALIPHSLPNYLYFHLLDAQHVLGLCLFLKNITVLVKVSIAEETPGPGP